MEKAQRFQLKLDYEEDGEQLQGVSLRADDAGDWVTYEAHAAIVAELEDIVRSYRSMTWPHATCKEKLPTGLCLDGEAVEDNFMDSRCVVCQMADTALDALK